MLTRVGISPFVFSQQYDLSFALLSSKDHRVPGTESSSRYLICRILSLRQSLVHAHSSIVVFNESSLMTPFFESIISLHG
jgi:hypothetical protein